MLNILYRAYCTFFSQPPAPSIPIAKAFPEEPLFLSGKEGSGFFPARPGLLLNDSRYKILRKLGRGQFSSTWLASDYRADESRRYCAIKVLTVHATKGHRDGQLLELEIMQAVAAFKDVLGLPILRDHFEMDGPHGQHLCIVMPVLSTDISSFRRSAPTKRLEVPIVKIIIAQVVAALRKLHTAHIIHTDLKPDNVLFDEGTGTGTIQKLLDESPVQIDGEFELDGVRYPLVRSQPIPHPFKWNDPGIIVEQYPVRLTDLGHAQWADKEPTTRLISPYSLRAPEVILGADFGTKADIWSLGCMTFELLTGQWLFDPHPGKEWSIEDDHLAKMIELTGETFSDTMLARCRKHNEYFNEEGKLVRISRLLPVTFEEAITNYGIPEAEITVAAAFIRACLRLNPEDRSSADDLETHVWLENAFTCC